MATSSQVQAVATAVAAFEAEVTADVGELLTNVQTLQASVTALQAQLAAGTLGADDIAALAGMANDLAAQTAALHEKVNPAPATPAAPAS